MPSDPKTEKAARILMIRMLGNDLTALHGETQTYDNLKFTLENELCLPHITKHYVLNRIVGPAKQRRLEALLQQHAAEYSVLPYVQEEFLRLGRVALPGAHVLQHSKIRSAFMRQLRTHNLYLVNNNGCRNWCIDYGKRMDFQWTVVLDSNSFFLPDAMRQLHKTLTASPSVQYMTFTQVRLKDGELQNNTLLTNDAYAAIESLPLQEPQLAFCHDSTLSFNADIPYGSSPKADLLRVLGIPGRWRYWKDNTTHYGIPDRPPHFPEGTPRPVAVAPFPVVRLHPGHDANNIASNYNRRILGVYGLCCSIWNRCDL